jgi:hypothetical protein
MTADPAQPYLDRLDAIEERLSRLAEAPAPGGLTEPDEPSGERWDWGQVWAHMAEFPAYWIGQLREAFSGGGAKPGPFGRTKADPGRVSAIERDRHVSISVLMERLRPQLADLRGLLAQMSPDDWTMTVSHSTLGTMGMDRVMEEFLVGHLEAHAAQLDSLVERS